MTEAKTVVMANVEGGLADGVRFGEESDGASAARRWAKADLEMGLRDIEAARSRPQQPDAAGLGGADQGVYQSLISSSPRQGADQQSRTRSAFAQLLEQRWNLGQGGG